MTMGRGHIGSWPLWITDLLDDSRKIGIAIHHQIDYKPVLVEPQI
jgi:hypothetical protein